MCGRFVLQLDGDGWLHAYVATKQDRAAEWEPVYSIAPPHEGAGRARVRGR